MMKNTHKTKASDSVRKDSHDVGTNEYNEYMKHALKSRVDAKSHKKNQASTKVVSSGLADMKVKFDFSQNEICSTKESGKLAAENISLAYESNKSVRSACVSPQRSILKKGSHDNLVSKNNRKGKLLCILSFSIFSNLLVSSKSPIIIHRWSRYL